MLASCESFVDPVTNLGFTQMSTFPQLTENHGVPVPLSETAVAALCALVLMLIVPVSGPIMVGAKVTIIEQEPPATTGDEEAQLSVTEKSPPVFTPTMLIGELLAFVRVSVCVPAVPKLWLPKPNEGGRRGQQKGHHCCSTRTDSDPLYGGINGPKAQARRGLSQPVGNPAG